MLPIAHLLLFLLSASFTLIHVYAQNDDLSQSVLTTSKAHSQSSPILTCQVIEYTESLLKTHSSPGLAIAVVLRDPSAPNGFYSELASFGSARADTPATPDTLFAIASNSKLFLALSVGLLVSNNTLQQQLHAQGKVRLDWNTKIRDIIPEWGLMDELAGQEATVLDLLVHRTGMPRHDLAGPAGANVSQMISNLRYLRPSASFRETFQYNNMMFETLSYLPQLLLNQSFESYVSQHVFSPLGMNSSTYSVAQAEKALYPTGYKFKMRKSTKPVLVDLSGKPTFAHGHQYSKRDFYKNRQGVLRPTVPYFQRPGEETVWAGAGGILTSARDMVPWLSTLLNAGCHPDSSFNKTIIPPAVLERIERGVSVSEGKASFPELSPKVYGPAQWRYSYRGHEIIEHGGNNPGFKSQVARFSNLAPGTLRTFPNATGLGIAVFSNDADGGVVLEAVKWRIVDELFGLEPIDWYSRYVKEEAEYYEQKRNSTVPPPSVPSPPPLPLTTMQSRVFEHPTYGHLRFCYVSPALYAIRIAHNSTNTTTSTNTTMGDTAEIECSSVLAHPTTQLILEDTPPELPTLIASFKRTFATHMRLTHWSGGLFNVSAVWGNQGLDQGNGCGMNAKLLKGGADVGEGILIGLDERFEVEWVVPGGRNEGEEEGLAFRGGFWGMEGPDARAPVGKGKAGAEVWFGKV
ncbi:Gigasin-6 [Hypsizygus marmoreus]|uniref:Gigasin-6 n=1 Tax=Hypsizygus marmoreus TaxID=39966 RepID=A0A369J966_HYPMA|nr:Gigasin-6 [Hypsizygus marmoreus]